MYKSRWVMYLNMLSPNKLYHGILLKLYAAIKRMQACKAFEYTDFNIDMLECNIIITIIQSFGINVNIAWISNGLQHHIVMSFGQLLKQIQFTFKLNMDIFAFVHSKWISWIMAALFKTFQTI